MRVKVTVLAAVLGLMAVFATAVTASAASITVAPTRVPIGGTVTVSGDVFGREAPPGGGHGCFLGGLIVLISDAFAGHDTFPGTNGAVKASISEDGRFRVRVTILSGVKPGTYTITARCDVGDIGVVAMLVVTSPGLPATGLTPTQQTGTINGALVVTLATAALTVLCISWVVSGRVRAALEK
jgi:hypothetical protein